MSMIKYTKIRRVQRQLREIAVYDVVMQEFRGHRTKIEDCKIEVVLSAFNA